jgi:hypothetical protein
MKRFSLSSIGRGGEEGALHRRIDSCSARWDIILTAAAAGVEMILITCFGLWGAPPLVMGREKIRRPPSGAGAAAAANHVRPNLMLLKIARSLSLFIVIHGPQPGSSQSGGTFSHCYRGGGGDVGTSCLSLLPLHEVREGTNLLLIAHALLPPHEVGTGFIFTVTILYRQCFASWMPWTLPGPK